MKLSEATCKNFKPCDAPYKKADGHGLNLLVMPNGSKYWRLRYRYGGKEKQLALGVYPDVSLSEARKQSDLARQMIKTGIDPADVRREERKNKPKPATNKKQFNFSLSADNTLTIETATRIIHLTEKQAKALHTFLDASFSESGKEK